jgi:hypothetical protein
MTVLIGKNGVGKSHLLKSLYWTFGAEPAMVNSKWKGLNVASLLDFTLNGDRYFAYRKGNLFALFSDQGEIIKISTNITSDYGPFLSEWLGFNLTLASRQGTPVIAPPAFCFLPFYIDQDASWQKPWAGFARLGQFQNPKRDVAYFHSGIRPREYYLVKAKAEEASAAVVKLNAEAEAWRSTIRKLEQTQMAFPISFDLSEYQDEVDRLLIDLKELEKHNEAYRSKFTELSSKHILLEKRASAAAVALQSLEEDLNASISHSDHVECPTCGSVFDNSFVEQFRIFDDADVCRHYIDQSHVEMIENLKDQEKVRRMHLSSESLFD